MRGKLFHQWDPVIIWGLQQYKACLKVWSSRERWGTHSCVMEQHRLMKQQTTIMWQRGSRLQYKGMCGDSLPLAPLPTSLLISLFPRFVHTPCLLQAKAVKCMHRKRAAHYFLTEKKKIQVYYDIARCSCKIMHRGNKRLGGIFLLSLMGKEPGICI